MCILTWKILILPANDCTVWWIEMNRCSLLLIICKIHVNKNWGSAYTCTLNLRTLVSTYVQVFCWSRSPWNLLFLAKSLITSGLENHKFIIFCWAKSQVQSPRCMYANYYLVRKLMFIYSIVASSNERYWLKNNFLSKGHST